MSMYTLVPSKLADFTAIAEKLKKISSLKEKLAKLSDKSAPEGDKICEKSQTETLGFVIDTKGQKDFIPFSADEEADVPSGDFTRKTRVNPMKQIKEKLKLSSEIDLGCQFESYNLEFNLNYDPLTRDDEVIPKPKLVNRASENADADKELMKKSVLRPGFEQQESLQPLAESKRQAKLKRIREREKTKGSKWFNMPATEMNEERKNDLMVLQMRAGLNPKQFYKKNDLKTLPKYYQIGTVVDNPIDFYHSRVPKKQRKRTLVEELMADSDFQNYAKRKLEEAKEADPKEMKKARRERQKKEKRKRKSRTKSAD